MSISSPFTDVEIKTQDDGFFEDNTLPIALISKEVMVALVLWPLIEVPPVS